MPKKKSKYLYTPIIKNTPFYYHNSKFNLEIKESGIKNAGFGVFTNDFIPKNTFIDFYTGNYGINTLSGYYFQINETIGIDAGEYPRCYMAMLNDAYKSKFKNNCDFVVKEYMVEVWSLSDIQPGHELLISYGDDYFS